MAGDNIKMTVSSATGTPTTSFTLGSAPTGYNTIGSQYSDGDVLTYFAWEGDDWQVCQGTYTASGTTLSVDNILRKSVSGTVTDLPTGITFTSAAEIIVTDSGLNSNSSIQNNVNGYFLPHNIIAYTNNGGPAPNRLQLEPIMFHNPVVINQVGLEVVTPVASTGVYLGLYTCGDDGLPSQLVFDSGVISTAASGQVFAALSSSVILPAGNYWVGGVGDSGSVVARVSRYDGDKTSFANHYGNHTYASNAPGSLVYYTHTYGALPTDLSATSPASTTERRPYYGILFK